MSRIDELIEELCPDGVPWRAIGSFAACIVGATPSSGVSDYWDGGDIPWMSSGEANRKTITYTEKSITQKGFDSSSTKLVPPDSVVIALAGQGKTRGLVAITRIALCTNQSLCAMICDSTVLPDYLFYFLSSRYLELRGLSAGEGGRGGLNLQIIRNYSLPIPPLDVQREIVSILDKFTQLEAELEAELEARRIQYEVTRDRLLDFRDDLAGHAPEQKIPNLRPSGIESFELSELGKLFSGLSGKSKGDFSDGNSPFVSYLDIGNNSSLPREIKTKVRVGHQERQNEVRQGDLLFTGSSEDREGVGLTAEVEYSPSEPTYLNSFCFGFRPREGAFAMGYLKHLFRSTTVRTKVKACSNGVTRINISKKSLVKIEIPVPPLEVQANIVSILDKLDALVNDITYGLPAEITARRKQYEYYRNKLLTFRELEAA